MALVETQIDGQEIEVQRDRWALEVATEMGIEIPTLCHHPALEPYGACRLCVVEVSKGHVDVVDDGLRPADPRGTQYPYRYACRHGGSQDDARTALDAGPRGDARFKPWRRSSA